VAYDNEPSRSAKALLDFENDIHFYRSIGRERRHAYSRAGMLTNGLAEHLDHQVGKSVDNLRLIAEVVGGIDHADNFDYALHAIQATQRRANLCQHYKASLPSGLVALLDGQIPPTLPLGVH